MDPYTLVEGFHFLCYDSELHGDCGQPKWKGLELVGTNLDVKSQIFPGLRLYGYMDVGILEVY